MEVPDTKTSSSYVKPPWLFKGSALYQLHLVKAETARAFIPKDFRLVEAFGYTLGGFFLAHYDDSPAGIFDELVVIAGIVWNPPTSCAWAARVLVNSQEACFHGRKCVGLPSQVAGFSKRTMAISERSRNKKNGFLNMFGMGSAFFCPKNQLDIQVMEIKGSSATDFCNISLPTAESKSDNMWMGPTIKMSLPSFSGNTKYTPHLLKYSCQISCRVRPVVPAKVSGPISATENDRDMPSNNLSFNSEHSEVALSESDAWNRSISVLLSKPIMALEFNFLKMQVEAPTIISYCSEDAGRMSS
ncbi:PREDICTED: protein NEOXANTHIN-DEFICIENT 1 isoform X2 [Nelumbo nucifera]|uniref:Protein NEOXANTHIN-DEFICIENT 1 isoform X2 n=2 Tax=Nelumbo nucifera TaxID=4432 RepID=A0A1U8Q2R5_NELNU|nr:PREDICTED: protein NEOXANTHIN-DEFICIENT 1 isoform X2 [Nelumbo nucifera]